MESLLLKYIVLISVIWFQKTLLIVASSGQNENSVGLISDFVAKKLSYCKINFVSIGSIRKTSENTLQDQLLANLIASEKSGGITNIKLRRNQTEILKLHRPIPYISSSCSVSVILLTTEVEIQSIESVLTEALTKPVINPFTVKNADKYVFIIQGSNKLESLENSPLVTKLKYKLAISISPGKNEPVKGHSFCPHCPGWKSQSFDMQTTSGFGNIDFYFPDFQKNFYGALHRVVASQKISSLMEIKENKATGKYFAARGSHAAMLFHLIRKLNFTYEILPAARGSTGLQLPNGTWIGAVGDILYGKADWAHLVAVDYSRNQFVESCSGVSDENWGFLVGPALPVYTWKAIFWPFTTEMWICIVSASFVSIGFGHCFIRYGYTGTDSAGSKIRTKHNYVNVAEFLVKTLIGQSEDIPVNLPQPIKIFYGFWLLFALVGTTAYTSKLMTFMTFPVVEQVPENFQQLARSDYGIALQYFGSVVDSILKNSRDPTFMKVIQRMEKELDPLTCISKTVKSKYVCMTYEVFFNDLKYKNISNRLGHTPIRLPQTAYGFSFEVGVAHEKKAALSQNFKWIIRRVQEMGIVMHWKVMHFADLLKDKNDWERKTGKSQELAVQMESTDRLQLSHLIGSFVIYFTGIISGLLIFGLEKAREYYSYWAMKHDTTFRQAHTSVQAIKLVAFDLRR